MGGAFRVHYCADIVFSVVSDIYFDTLRTLEYIRFPEIIMYQDSIDVK